MQKMIDNDDQREDRKIMPRVDIQREMADEMAQGPQAANRPNRKTRRMIAKRRGVFKHQGGWGYVNGRSTNQSNGGNNHEN